MIFHWLFNLQNQYYNFSCGAFSEVVFEFECGAIYFGSMGVNLILAPHGIPINQ